MWVFWTIATLCFIVGGVLWKNTMRVALWEWLVGSAVAFILAGAFQMLSIIGMTADTETWSGQIVKSVHQPPWVEYYEYAVYRTEVYTETVSRTDSKGNVTTSQEMRTRQVFDHWEPTTAYHAETWYKGDSLDQTWTITREEYTTILQNFGQQQSCAGSRSTWNHNSRLLSGDPLDYFAVNVHNYIYPTTATRMWSNKVKACPSVFTFPEVAPGTAVFDYPKNSDPFSSNRLLGDATRIGIFEWDRMNARLGPAHKVNVVMCGFSGAGAEIAQMQKNKWVGGKKNDLVICYSTGADKAKATWVDVFGWTDSEVCKATLRTIVLNGPIDQTLIAKIEAEVGKNYVIKDWSQFDYLSVEPPVWTYWVFFLVLGAVEVGLYWYFWVNDVDQMNAKQRRSAWMAFKQFWGIYG